MRILIVEDDADSRKLLFRILRFWGHEICVARNGAEAWQILEQGAVSFVISDWMMPEMDGLELCRRIRSARFPHYIYIILLTAKDAKNELVEGMEAGADDFIVKPFNSGELNVRIRAGERILKLERDLAEQNQKLSQAFAMMRKDLESAAKMQKSFLPNHAAHLSGVKFEWIFFPSKVVAGDIFNFYQLDENNIAFYLLDVAGHGIASAMLSVTLSKMLSLESYKSNTRTRALHDSGTTKTASPAEVIQYLNKHFQCDEDTSSYFTILYGVINIDHQKLKICQAAHPSPVLIRSGRKPTLIGDGGYPVGLFPDLEYEEQEYDFSEGHRLFVYSDGIIECGNPRREMFSQKRLMDILDDCQNLPLHECMEVLKKRLRTWRASDEFDDDVSMLAIERLPV